ncbi:MAG: hypothetical protein ACOY90_09320 [Candidatus Zhuqueibacterota bacterium]
MLKWLLDGDASIRWQVLRDIVRADPARVASEREKVAATGWGAALLAWQESSGMWGHGLYSPKWISTTYTLLALRHLGLSPDNGQAQKACQLLLDRGFYPDGGVNLFASLDHSETCVTGMILSLVAYFKSGDERMHRLVEFLLDQQMADGGWNCESFRGARHSSFHTTISALEGLLEYENFHPGRVAELAAAQQRGREFLLIHRLYKSHRTGQVVNPVFTRLSFPPRWHYDILRALDYFREAGAVRDERLGDAIEIVRTRQDKDGRLPLQNRHPGRTFFEMETPGQPSRWNTLRAMRVLDWWEAR